MEAWNDGDRVRPIPIDDDELADGAPQVPQRPQPPSRGPKRPWLPLAVAIAAVAVAVVSVTIFGALRFDDADPTAGGDLFSPTTTDAEGSTTTATTLPPRLEELLPGITDRLTLITVQEDTAWTLLWDPTFRIPKALPLGVESTPRGRIGLAAFDAGGRVLSLERCDGQGACDVFVGSPTDLGTDPDVEDALAHTWHASEVARIAWVAPSTDGYTLSTGTVNPLSNTVDDRQAIFTSTEPFRVAQWDSAGFVVNFFIDDARVVALSTDGQEQWVVSGTATSATDSIVAVVEGSSGWRIVDRATADPLETTRAPEEVLYVGTSDSAQLVARLAARSEGRMYSLTVMGGNLNAPRIITIEHPYQPLGFTADGTYFLFLDGDGSVVFVDWNKGPSRTVDAPEGHRVIGIDVG